MGRKVLQSKDDRNGSNSWTREQENHGELDTLAMIKQRGHKAKRSDFFMKLHHLKEKIDLFNDVFIGEEIVETSQRRKKHVSPILT